jgi:hypothetical protein
MPLIARRAGTRPLRDVPRPALWLLVVALALYIGVQLTRPGPVAEAAALEPPPAAALLRLAVLGEPVPAAQLMLLYLQSFDNQPGISIPFAQLDYGSLAAWLSAALELDPAGQYPLMMAAQLYAQVPDPPRQRMMLEWVHRAFLAAPEQRWRWLAHCAIVAKHRLRDNALALRYAEDIARHAGSASGWARQMRIFVLEDMGEIEQAKVLLGGLLASGEVTDPGEIHFLTERLEQMKSAETSSAATKARRLRRDADDMRQRREPSIVR